MVLCRFSLFFLNVSCKVLPTRDRLGGIAYWEFLFGMVVSVRCKIIILNAVERSEGFCRSFLFFRKEKIQFCNKRKMVVQLA